MNRRLKDPLRDLSVEEYEQLRRLSRSGSDPAEHEARAKALLAVAEGCTCTEAARRAGRRSNDAVSQLVSRFNVEGLAALLRTCFKTRDIEGNGPISEMSQKNLRSFLL